MFARALKNDKKMIIVDLAIQKYLYSSYLLLSLLRYKVLKKVYFSSFMLNFYLFSVKFSFHLVFLFVNYFPIVSRLPE